ncbi:MAG TPA: hypothetical protein VJ846_14205 [Sphingomicrobium sp.]|jgi:hypothetical protein|nr:hypothetical protein [Sphingomicrobium sp.]
MSAAGHMQPFCLLPYRDRGHEKMLRAVVSALAAYLYLQSAFALADDAAKQLARNWKLSEGRHIGNELLTG